MGVVESEGGGATMGRGERSVALGRLTRPLQREGADLWKGVVLDCTAGGQGSY